MELTQLRHFLAAVKHGNLVKAAEEQNITQSGLSRSIITLERVLDMQLLKRTPGGIEPTAFGLSLIPHAETILNQERRASKELLSLKQLKRGAVSMAITLNYSHYFVPAILDEILQENPGIQIEVVSGGYAELIDGVRQARFDFLFGLLAAERQPPDVVEEELFTARSIIVANADHPLVSKETRELGDLSTAQWAMLNGEGFQRAFALYFYSRGLAIPYQALKTNSLALLRHVITTQDLLTVLPRDIVSDDIAAGILAQVAMDTPADFTRVGLVYKTEPLFTPAVEYVLAKIRAHAKPYAAAHQQSQSTKADSRRTLSHVQ